MIAYFFTSLLILLFIFHRRIFTFLEAFYKAYQIMQKIKLEVYKEPEFLIHSDTLASVSYSRGGQKYVHYLPYHKRKIAKMSSYQFTLHKGGEKINITHQAGIPYLLTVNDFAGEKIVVKNLDTEEEKEYTESEVIGFPDF